ncbi:uncharacterized protein LOC107795283 [Nicotiana tabacum]|uniref:Threonylcarbamoyl-AMP synthase n=2 Tax=Nicotiana TaxID=4085 RepID=A0A1S4A9R3_TOBAC|nr:PREDICTED: yrdC domain-containing protein, mitochondrial-like [Nicotiana sylvestris]XP_016473377.1 PREDICTED: yrdC domain-containing protein, mitochondrial-like [Nicotiana tabacum]
MAWSLEKSNGNVETKVVSVSPATEDYAEETIEVIKAEKVITVPTDTLYGFACDACSAEAVNRIYEIKGRDSSILEKSLNPGLESIGVRVPDYNFIRAVAHGSRSALSLTSTNLSGQPSIINIKDFENLWEHCAYVYDGGILPAGRAGSTMVDLTKLGKYKILRPGSAKEETVAILERLSLLEDGTGD